jgi:zinc/manganese transport system substrate-binding protein
MIMILILVHPARPRLRSAAASAAATLCVTALIACGSDGGGSATIAATTGVTADIAGNIAGPDLGVEQIVPDGASPHDFELSAQDRQRLEEADVVIANGSGLEAGIPLDELDVPVWTLTDHVGDLRRPVGVEGADDEEGSVDPHVWMDPTRVAAALPSLADSLADADPEHADEYRARARRYARDLRSLDREIADTLASVPARDRELVTSHDSVGYLAERYGFDVVATAFPATGPEAEASAARIRDLERTVRDSGVPAVFAEQSDDPEALRLVAEQTGVAVNYDLLVESPSTAGSYEEMLRHDARLLARDLGR